MRGGSGCSTQQVQLAHGFSRSFCCATCRAPAGGGSLFASAFSPRPASGSLRQAPSLPAPVAPGGPGGAGGGATAHPLRTRSMNASGSTADLFCQVDAMLDSMFWAPS